MRDPVREGPDALVSTKHLQAWQELGQLLIAPGVVPEGTAGVGNGPDPEGTRPPSPPRAGHTHQWWWVVRMALSTTSSFLMICSSWKGPRARGEDTGGDTHTL